MDSRENSKNIGLKGNFSKTVLLIDDDSEQLNLLELRLKGAGYEVISAESVSDGLKFANDDEFDIAICDVVMPHQSGYEFAYLFKKLNKQNGVPVVLMTAGTTASIAPNGHSVRFKADAFIMKKNINSELLDKIADLLRN